MSPALQADQRALTVEAVVPNTNGELKPGLFATARIEQPAKTPAILVPAAAVQTIAGTSRVFVVTATMSRNASSPPVRRSAIGRDHQGLKAGERVATANVAQLADGMK